MLPVDVESDGVYGRCNDRQNHISSKSLELRCGRPTKSTSLVYREQCKHICCGIVSAMAMELGGVSLVLGGGATASDFTSAWAGGSGARVYRRGSSAFFGQCGALSCSNRHRRSAKRAWSRNNENRARRGLVVRAWCDDKASRLSLSDGISCWTVGGQFQELHRWKISAVAVQQAEQAVKEVEVEPVSTPYDFLESEEKTEKSPSKRGKHSAGASSVSSGVRLEHISKTFKGVTLLKDVSWEVKKGERVGLVGINGAGKTTQLKIISGDEVPDSGNVIKAKDNMLIAFLTQEFEVVPSRTLREEFLSAFKEQMDISKRIEQVQMALETATENMELMGRLLDELDKLQKKAEASDLYDVDVKINKVMPEVGFSEDDNDRLVASFSGGWQMRISLGKILLQEPDLLLLDEPTNHLDMDTIQWLEGYLKKLDVPMVIVSHDRAFLDQLCTKIVETDMGISRTYEGNYSNYVQAKSAWAKEQEMKWEKQQKEISHVKEQINSSSNSGQATAAKKQLDKIQEKDLVEKPFEHKSIKFRFPELERSGRIVVTIRDMRLQYENKVLFKNANLTVERGEKLAFIGPNGCGKSTLLRLILGTEKPSQGEVILGEHRVVPNYFEQNQAEALDLEKTVLQTVVEAAEEWKLDDIKGLLGKCNFKAETLPRKVAFLSGGEKARLAFCKFMVKPSTLLVLDEPTNHLDIPTKEMLEEALREYQGTVLVVSHDRYFLRQIVNRVVEVKDGDLAEYNGNYNYYLERNLEARRKELERERELESKGPTVKAKSKMTKAEKELQKKQKAQTFNQKNAKGKVSKNAKRWN